MPPELSNYPDELYKVRTLLLHISLLQTSNIQTRAQLNHLEHNMGHMGGLPSAVNSSVALLPLPSSRLPVRSALPYQRDDKDALHCSRSSRNTDRCAHRRESRSRTYGDGRERSDRHAYLARRSAVNCSRPTRRSAGRVTSGVRNFDTAATLLPMRRPDHTRQGPAGVRIGGSIAV